MATADPTTVYARFLEALNAKDLEAAQRCVDPARYRENCIGFTRGFVAWPEAKASLREVWKGLSDLHVELHDLAGTGDVALAHGTATGTNTGRLYGAPPSRRSYRASFFDRVRVADGLIVERVQQADVVGQMRQLYGRAFGTVGLGALLWRQ